jgi:choline dehydrogenase-like flavoprotein
LLNADFIEADYVIVGAGSSGCVLANRLSEDTGATVCLIEAGPPDRSPFIHVPLGVMRLIKHRVLNWRYETAPQPQAANRPIYIPRGRTLGGSSSINGMVYMRGHKLDYDDWAKAGNTGWSYAEVLPYFKKSENNEQFGGDAYHGRGGLLNVKDLDHYNPLAEILFEAASSLQFPRSDDFNGAQQEGFGRRQVTQRNGWRESSATAFLNPARRRPNLRIVTDTSVARVTFDGHRATGIEGWRSGRPIRIKAKREVIVSAGTIGSPALLQRSGIGDNAMLQSLGVPILHDAPEVGRNLQDHMSAAIRYTSPTTLPYGLSLKTLPWVAASVFQYAFFRRGLLANNILHAGGFVRTDPNLDRPDIQFILMPANYTPSGQMGIGHGYGLITIVLRPKSRGSVRLASADPQAPPRIDPQFFSDSADVSLMTRGLRLGRRLLDTEAFAPVRGAEWLPGPDVQTDAALEDYVRQQSVTVFHPVGTCRMGPDAGAVVDPQLRVRGVEGLRIVDVSIMPTLIGGNTNAPAIMIAEKAADMIRGRPPLPAAANDVA